MRRLIDLMEGYDDYTRKQSGFANAATANVVLHMQNVRRLYAAARQIVMTAASDEEASEMMEQLAMAYWPERVTDEGYRLAEVNWDEVAAHIGEP